MSRRQRTAAGVVLFIVLSHQAGDLLARSDWGQLTEALSHRGLALELPQANHLAGNATTGCCRGPRAQ